MPARGRPAGTGTFPDEERPRLPAMWYFWLEVRERQAPNGGGALVWELLLVDFTFSLVLCLATDSESAAGILFILLSGGAGLALLILIAVQWHRRRRFQRYLDQGTMMTRLARRRWADEAEAEMWRSRPRWTRLADKGLLQRLPEPTWPTRRDVLR
ncbi:hypothetical protein [Parafrankia sp. EUN1f]|uniref:hypothetical protein n=1 Tax=Parafrankia sp. EUN1f TaxID=102897 RepID=UPI0001C45F0E|nr:hypothetical protein [Parafrankia sp. EUN1f]EFC81790.1 hypothetical protein FrEUN1fDRAFT_5113 [Parafrankia sp. EUN1f]